MPCPERAPNASVAEVRAELADYLSSLYPRWPLKDLAVLGGGLEFLVFTSRRSPWGPVAVRTPRQRWISNDNDPLVDARQLLEQEAELLRYVRRHGIAAPAVHALHVGGRCDFLIAELMKGERHSPSSFSMGRLARQIHDLPPPTRHFVADPHGDLAATLAERITRRARVVERLGQVDVQLPPPPLLEHWLGWLTGRRSLLHMDLRPANLLVRSAGRLAPADWSNALVGHPSLELARIAEFGYGGPRFLAGYRTPDPLKVVPPPVGYLCRLDAALMLAVVFLSEAPDLERGQRHVNRVLELAAVVRNRT